MEIITDKNQDAESYKIASKKVKKIKGFYIHLTQYVIVNLVLIFINLKYTPEYLWFLWPLLGWGVSVIIHGVVVFDALPFFNKNWEQKKIHQFMEQEKKNNSKYI